MQDFRATTVRGPLPDSIGVGPGVLVDTVITNCLKNGYLLYPETAAAQNVRYSSYQLRIGPEIEFLELAEAERRGEQPYRRKPDLQRGDTFEVRPGDTVKLFCEEKLNVPFDVMALAVPVGNLYELGLSPEVTFADPGFHGPFWVIVCNYSSRIVELKVGEPLARLIFTRFCTAPESVHGGYSAVGKPPRYPKRLPKRPLEELSKEELVNILNEISGHDSPHYEHAFVTSRVKQALEEQLAGVRKQAEELGRRIALAKLLVYVSLFGTAGFIWTVMKPLLPATIVAKINDAWIAAIIVGLGIVATFLQKDIRKLLREMVGSSA